MKTIVLIACVKEKQSNPCRAIDLYQGKDFTNWVSYSKKINADKIYILSGKHGLLNPDEIIEPYDFNLNNANKEYKKKWSDLVLFKLSKETNLKKDNYILLCNDIYAENLLSQIKNYSFPFKIK
ncbi:MAG: hypothetical protein P8I93_03045 [Crocinitomicaceae bacterium]|nr:hypothetical protein [Crocinitomicaceae bacterium]